MAKLGDNLYVWLFAGMVGALVHQQVDIPIWSLDVGGFFWLLVGTLVGLYRLEVAQGRLT